MLPIARNLLHSLNISELNNADVGILIRAVFTLKKIYQASSQMTVTLSIGDIIIGLTSQYHFYSLPPVYSFHPDNTVSIHHVGLDQLVPENVVSMTNTNQIINELQKNNLANKILDVYYRIKRNVEYIAQGKESLHSVYPRYNTFGTNLLNARHSRHYFYLIAPSS